LLARLEQLRVGEDRAAAPLVLGDQGAVTAPAAGDVVVEAAVGEIGLAADEPAEARPAPVEHLVPAPEPGQRLGGPGPERVGLLERLALPAADDRVDQIHDPASGLIAGAQSTAVGPACGPAARPLRRVPYVAP